MIHRFKHYKYWRGGGGGGGGSGGPGAVLFKTVAQMQALAASNAFILGQLYEITDADATVMSGDGTFIIMEAITVNELAVSGVGFFKNANMSNPVDAIMDYDLASDHISRVFASPDGVLAANDVTDYGNGSLTKFIFDSADIYANRLDNITLPSFSPLIFHSNTMLDQCQLRISNNSLFLNNFCYPLADIRVGENASCTISNCKIDGALIATENHSLIYCEIMDNMSVNLSNIAPGYLQTSKSYTSQGSNFIVTGDDNSSANIVSAVIDMQLFPWAGVIKPTNVGNFTTFSNFPTDHSWILVPPIAGGTVVVYDKGAGAGGNIQLEIVGSVTLDGSHGDWMSFQASYHDTSNTVSKIAGATYPTA